MDAYAVESGDVTEPGSFEKESASLKVADVFSGDFKGGKIVN